MPKPLARLAALVVACVFASLPTLARVHDRLSTHDEFGSFRLSKNLERPHEKIGAAAVAATALALVHRDTAPCGEVADPIVVPVTPSFSAPLAARAPPVR